jgi:NAD(P)-dependent dehydrogenase (short-subunit alcohol dehydrogenase family)
MLLASDEGHIINTSSVNGFWASLGPESSHTAYSAAKFAVKGFSEALVTDLRRYAPHVKVSVVMPGHIGTSIVSNTLREFARSESADGTSDALAALRRRLDRFGLPAQEMTDEEARAALRRIAEDFRDRAPATAAEAAPIILDGVKEERWRTLVGDDAQVLDRLVRENPEAAYEVSFMEKLRAETGWRLSR